jgi:hypothetical protein
MVPDTPPLEPRLALCVECGHDRTWHRNGSPGKKWTDEEWEVERLSTTDQGLCQWDDTPGTSLVNDEDPNGENKCLCKVFKHPNAPRRRDAIEHTRKMNGS